MTSTHTYFSSLVNESLPCSSIICLVTLADLAHFLMVSFSFSISNCSFKISSLFRLFTNSSLTSFHSFLTFSSSTNSSSNKLFLSCKALSCFVSLEFSFYKELIVACKLYHSFVIRAIIDLHSSLISSEMLMAYT